MKDLIEINELKALLGYDDNRSVLTWLRKMNVPLVLLGRKTYTHSQFLNNLVESELGFQGTPGGIGKNSPLQVIKTDKTVNIIPKHKETKHTKNNYS